MTDYEKFKQAQADAYERYCRENKTHGTAREERAFYAGWDAADAYADEQPQPVSNSDRFRNSDHFAGATKMLRAQAAIAAMQGLLAAGQAVPIDRAIELAVALVAKLEKKDK